jgi:hypothetical protein
MTDQNPAIPAFDPDAPGEFPGEALLIRAPAGDDDSGNASAEHRALVEVLRRAAPDADAEQAVFWRATVSNNTLDSYFTRMTRGSLKNYAADADWQNRGGVPFMNSHRTGGFLGTAELPLGRSLAGKFYDGRGGSAVRTVADFYTVRGLQLGEVGSDQFIRGLESGILRDVSISFRPGAYICSIDGEDMLRSDKCLHWPGRKYKVEVKGENGKTRTEEVLCTADVEDGHMTETSAVYRGATPGAAVHKMLRALEAGTLQPRDVRLLEQTYRLAPGTIPIQRSWVGYTPPSVTIGLHGVDVTPENRDALVGEISDQIAREMERVMTGRKATQGTPAETPAEGADETEETTETRAAAADTADVVTEFQRLLTQAVGSERLVGTGDLVTTLRGLVGERDALRTERDRLKGEAADVGAYRDAALARALVQGARAMGKHFDKDQWEGMLRGQPMAAILKATDAWEKQAADTFKPGRSAAADDETDALNPNPPAAPKRPSKNARQYLT